jgi:tellurite methyltransferase
MQDHSSLPLPTLSIDALTGFLATSYDVRLIDLRPRAAFEEAHLPGASRLSMDEIELPFLRPSRRRPLVLIADSTEAAREGARRFANAGYTASALDAPLSLWSGPLETGPERQPAWEPSPLVGKWAGHLPHGRVLDLACGSGRDAVYLAMRGAEVTGIDILPDALAQAAILARRHEVTLDLRRGDIERDPACWEGHWGAIHVHRFLYRPALPLLMERLQEGGWLLYETFTEAQSRAGRKPRAPAHLLKEGELLAAAGGLTVVEYGEGENEDGDWTAVLVARKETGNEA